MRINKKSIGQLAIFGGKSSFDEPLHVGRPNIGNRDSFLRRVNHMLDQRWLTNKGQYVQEFEQKIACYLGAKHCIATCNGTSALQIISRALGLRGEVIVPSFTFLATPHALEWQELHPVFCDIDPATHNCDPVKVEKLITPRTTGIVGVHLWGRACDVEALDSVAKRHQLKILYDAAHAFGCSYREKMIGNFGDAEIFSFHATKIFNTFEGGAIVTNNDSLAAQVRYMKNFGFGGHDRGIYVGTNGKMTEVSAAMGLTNLESLKEFIQINKLNYERYRSELDGVAGVELIKYDESEKNNYQYVVLNVDRETVGISCDQMAKILLAENVIVKRYFSPPCHQMEPYRSYFPHAGVLLPETQNMSMRLLCLPTGTNITPEHICHICQIIRLIIKNGKRIKVNLVCGRLA